jgi:hypothetical protein
MQTQEKSGKPTERERERERERESERGGMKLGSKQESAKKRRGQFLGN